mmetsp:Transcript_38147/g.85445  ORF Transcript_38147/g.85445 Transcript_38147/m.85445 type:complete len:156 (-) Transcript_38147:219-686(-)
MKAYDTNKSGKLERDQLVKLLTDMDLSTPAGQEPSQDEVDWVLKLADEEGDGCVNLKELEVAVTSWSTFTSKRTELEATLDKYDKSGSGRLEESELKEYLTDLNGGKDVSDEEVQWVLKQADAMGDGGINKLELVRATAEWYGFVARKQSCCVMT